MADRTSIEWTDATWNPFGGCSRASEGCRNCYAEIMAARFSDPGQWGHGLARRVTLPDGSTDHRWTGKTVLHERKLDQPLRWKRPRRIFVNSTSDTFHESVPDERLDRLFAVMALCPQHTFQVLTKRPERMREYLCAARERIVDIVCERACEENWPVLLVYPPDMIPPPHLPGRHVDITRWPLPNAWLGTSVEDQATANARIPHLLATPAAVRFVSAEPLLGPVDLTEVDNGLKGHAKGVDALTGYMGSGMYGDYGPKVDWVICGGESGPGARPMHPDWARDMRDDCTAAGVDFFFKQWGEWAPGENCEGIPTRGEHTATWWNSEWSFDYMTPREMQEQHYDDEPDLYRVGKARAGRLLDGRTWDQMPEGRG